MDKKIIVTCKGADELPLEKIENFQGNLKKITKQNLDKLKKRIIKDGINVPLFIWRTENKNKLLDGHQRLKALQSLLKDGYEMPLIPVAYIEADDEKDARQKLLGITSQYGEFEIEELGEWLKEFDDDITGNFRLTEKEIEIVKINKKDIDDLEGDIKKTEIREYKKVHVLLSMGQDKFFEIKNKIYELKNIEGVEYEQSQN